MLSPTVIDPAAIYQDGDARLALGLTGATMQRARKSGLLRFTRLGRAILYRGQWLIDWLEGTSQPPKGSNYGS